MAAYNGERFIGEQMRSILGQLSSSDELIVVDDCSADNTCEIIAGICDSRVHLVRNERNLGVVKTFERALRQAEGEFVFLSDQDDIWPGNRVSRVMEAFCEDPSVTLVLTNGVKFREAGSQVVERIFRGTVKTGIVGTLIKNAYQGSLMAMRRTVVEAALPFPALIPMHDSWIGLVNSVIGRVKYLNEDLLYYRRHDGNVTGLRHAGMKKMTTDRWHLLISFLRIYPRLRAKQSNERQGDV
jgi:glycosyltransferase involved in cell wall biosynthesis